MSPRRMTILTFSLLELSVLVIFANDWAMVSCLLEMTCRLQDDRSLKDRSYT